MATTFPIEEIKAGCEHCGTKLPFEISFAFQPIVNLRRQSIFGYEALVRGVNGEGAPTILSQVNDQNRYVFDQTCRVKAIQLASELKLDKMLSINFLPNAVYQPEHCIQSTLRAAECYQFPVENIMFEITESEQVVDAKHLTRIFNYYQSKGFVTAIDDFGAGYAGLNLLTQFIPNIMKLDMELVRDVDKSEVKQIINRNLISTCNQLKITVLAEGIETLEEAQFFKDLGVYLMQGYYFAKPGFEHLPEVPKELYEPILDNRFRSGY
ncbi:EAL domain-containing protein [Thiosulfativibrio zosterae]|uniref:Diguanylate phosphodiesterase n=1 Tax=Thiosulfativibrio zosterae TaxID=2675053 RepID=A0A6F8PQI2_9GAMM|nr:EAL domain-containing protein [Thiosulfativibrio zosterae]BBP44383.1 diguanylate phosphodiesterase [Thiosulfativibrio zosterae]